MIHFTFLADYEGRMFKIQYLVNMFAPAGTPIGVNLEQPHEK
jgi:hypothetical protein